MKDVLEGHRCDYCVVNGMFMKIYIVYCYGNEIQ